MNTPHQIKQGEKFDGFGDTIDEMFAFDDSLRDRIIKVENMGASLQDIPTYSMQELQTINNDLKYKFSKSSLQKLSSVHKNIAWIFLEAAESFDIRIIYGRRSAQEQYNLFLQGLSNKDGYEKLSAHQSGRAIDSIPVLKGINMYAGGIENDLRWAYYNGFLKAIAVSRGIQIKSGWKWRIDTQEDLARPMSANKLLDANHIELVE